MIQRSLAPVLAVVLAVTQGPIAIAPAAAQSGEPMVLVPTEEPGPARERSGGFLSSIRRAVPTVLRDPNVVASERVAAERARLGSSGLPDREQQEDLSRPVRSATGGVPVPSARPVADASARPDTPAPSANAVIADPPAAGSSAVAARDTAPETDPDAVATGEGAPEPSDTLTINVDPSLPAELANERALDLAAKAVMTRGAVPGDERASSVSQAEKTAQSDQTGLLPIEPVSSRPVSGVVLPAPRPDVADADVATPEAEPDQVADTSVASAPSQVPARAMDAQAPEEATATDHLDPAHSEGAASGPEEHVAETAATHDTGHSAATESSGTGEKTNDDPVTAEVKSPEVVPAETGAVAAMANDSASSDPAGETAAGEPAEVAQRAPADSTPSEQNISSYATDPEPHGSETAVAAAVAADAAAHKEDHAAAHQGQLHAEASAPVAPDAAATTEGGEAVSEAAGETVAADAGPAVDETPEPDVTDTEAFPTETAQGEAAGSHADDMTSEADAPDHAAEADVAHQYEQSSDDPHHVAAAHVGGLVGEAAAAAMADQEPDVAAHAGEQHSALETGEAHAEEGAHATTDTEQSAHADEGYDTGPHPESDGHGGSDGHEIVAVEPLTQPSRLGSPDEQVEGGAIAPPFQLVRTLQTLQDNIAAGSTDALNAQKVLLAQMHADLLAVDPEVWQDRRNAEALIVYTLSGGRPEVTRELLSREEPPNVDERLLRAALAYVEGRELEARKMFETIDPLNLPSSMAGQVALAKSTLMLDVDRAQSMELLDVARLLSPGTLVEEAALRREIYLASERNDIELFERLALQYFYRFRNSIYAGNFRQRFADALTRMSFVDDPEQFERLNRLLVDLDDADKREMYLVVARAAVNEGKTSVAAKAADAALATAQPTSRDRSRALLYRGAALAVTPEGLETSIDDLTRVDRRVLTPSDAALFDAAAATADLILTAPEGSAMAEADLIEEDSNFPVSDVVSQAASAIEAVDALLQETQ